MRKIKATAVSFYESIFMYIYSVYSEYIRYIYVFIHT